MNVFAFLLCIFIRLLDKILTVFEVIRARLLDIADALAKVERLHAEASYSSSSLRRKSANPRPHGFFRLRRQLLTLARIFGLLLCVYLVYTSCFMESRSQPCPAKKKYSGQSRRHLEEQSPVLPSPCTATREALFNYHRRQKITTNEGGKSRSSTR